MNKTLIFIDYQKNVHAERFIDALRGTYKVEYFYVGNLCNSEIESLEKNISESTHIIVADYFRCALKLNLHNRKLVVISWTYDIVDYLNETKYGNIKLNVELLIVDSNYCENLWRRSGIKFNRIVKVPFGVDQRNIESQNFDKYSNKIISLRNWELVHNQQILLETLRLYKSNFNDFKFYFVGAGSTLPNLRSKYSDLEKIGMINFLGVLNNSEYMNILPTFKLAISTSKSDGASVSILESMVAGTPVLVADTEPNRELIKDMENGFLFNFESTFDLQKKLNLILRSDVNLNLISANAKKFAVPFANWSINSRIIVEEIGKLF
jgi:glycosyltransferase involved in cell wall biosynthesis